MIGTAKAIRCQPDETLDALSRVLTLVAGARTFHFHTRCQNRNRDQESPYLLCLEHGRRRGNLTALEASSTATKTFCF